MRPLGRSEPPATSRTNVQLSRWRSATRAEAIWAARITRAFLLSRTYERSNGGENSNDIPAIVPRSEEHTSELQSLMRISYAVFCLKKQNNAHNIHKPD